MSSLKKSYKTYSKYMKDFRQKKKVQSEKHYSSFWWDDAWATDGGSRFNGYSSGVKVPASSDLVKLIKLTSYQRAIANFVKIVTKQDIPVVFGGATSYTNGKQVTIASDISDKNFDVAVGLALHEASHVKLTDFQALSSYLKSDLAPAYDVSTLKILVNIIEDRRIDNYIFKSSPGYRAYYHKMYDHYFNNEMVTKSLVSLSWRNPLITEHYIFRIANLTNPLTDVNALPGLKEIINMIDVKDIGRLNSTVEVIDLAHKVLNKMLEQVNTNKSDAQKDPNLEDMSVQSGVTADGDGTPSNGNTDAMSELTADEERKVQQAWNKQKDFIAGEIKKPLSTKGLQSRLEEVSKLDLDLQMVGGDKAGFQCIIYNLSKKLYLRQLVGLIKKYDISSGEDKINIIKQISDLSGAAVRSGDSLRINNVGLPYFLTGYGVRAAESIQRGLDLGSLLGKKLSIRNEERSLVHNRLMSGHIDNKRLSHAGYGIETVFKQIHIDRYKQACLHISLDLSSSMNGRKWEETVQMCTAIVKAATYVQNLRVQVSLRATQDSGRKEVPMLIFAYDSKYNDIRHYIELMSKFQPVNCTPEGLCFDALMKKGLIIPTSSDCTSYFLNISDGEPGMQNWGGSQAVEFTRTMVNKMRNEMGVNILSFFVTDYSKANLSDSFIKMYGKDAKIVAADDVTNIARELNKKFLSEGKYSC